MVNTEENMLRFADGGLLPLVDATRVYAIPPAFAITAAPTGMPLQKIELSKYDSVWVEPISTDTALRRELRGWYHVEGRYAENEVGQRFYFDFYGAKWLAFASGPGNV